MSVWGGVCGSLCGVDGDVNDGPREDAPASGDAPDPTLGRLRDAVTRRRTELGLSQRKLAELAGGVSLGTATRLERGGEGEPRVSTVPKLEDALQWPRGGTFQAIRDGEDPPEGSAAAQHWAGSTGGLGQPGVGDDAAQRQPVRSGAVDRFGCSGDQRSLPGGADQRVP